jgi:hypothetical protein
MRHPGTTEPFTYPETVKETPVMSGSPHLRRSTVEPTPALFETPPRDPRYPLRVHEVTDVRDGLRWLYLGDTEWGDEPADFLIVLGHPTLERVLDLVGHIQATENAGQGVPDDDDLFATWARDVTACPVEKDHNPEDTCWTCETQRYKQGVWYLDWEISAAAADAGKTDENATREGYFPVWVWQLNSWIGWD